MSDIDVSVIVSQAEIVVGLPPDVDIHADIVNPEIAVGDFGPPGPRGPQGYDGDKGDPGEQGPPGVGGQAGDERGDEIVRPGEGRVQLREFDPLFETERGVLPYIEGTVRFTSNVDGTGQLEFEILSGELDWFDGWLAGIIMEVESSPGVWVRAALYTTRDDFIQRAGWDRVRVIAHETFGVWAGETLVMPEQMEDATWRTMPDDRQLGWMASAYTPAFDKFGEPWDACVEVPSDDVNYNKRPIGWPEDCPALWVTASGSAAAFQRKYFRGIIYVPDPGDGSRQKVRFYLSAEESTILYVAGSQVFEEEFSEGEWRDKFRARSIYLEPGVYAVGWVNDSLRSTGVPGGFHGLDPTIFAAALLTEDNTISEWLLASDATFGACRRTDDPDTTPGRPPGPTPGEALQYLFKEARDREASGWHVTTNSFTGTNDSKGEPWTEVVTERQLRVGDDYLDVLQALAETDDADCWIDPDEFTLNAAPARGEPCGLDWAEDEVYTIKVIRTGKRGTWAMGQSAQSFWYSRRIESSMRREFMLTMGQALSRWTAHRMLNAALRDTTRWDAEVHLDIPTTGWRPFIDFKVGDTGHITYRGHDRDIRVQGISGYPGIGGLCYRMEATEDLPPVDAMMGGGDG